MRKDNIPIMNIKKTITRNYLNTTKFAVMGLFFIGTQERVRNSEPSVFEPPKFYCIKFYVISTCLPVRFSQGESCINVKQIQAPQCK